VTKYLVEISDDLLIEIRSGREMLPDGFRVGEVLRTTGITGHGSSVVEVEDDGAPPELEGKLLCPTFRAHYAEDNSVERVEITSREIVPPR
jgi:hypothetical protein